MKIVTDSAIALPRYQLAGVVAVPANKLKSIHFNQFIVSAAQVASAFFIPRNVGIQSHAGVHDNVILFLRAPKLRYYGGNATSRNLEGGPIMPKGTRHKRTIASHSSLMDEGKQIEGRWHYAWHGSGRRWDAAWLQVAGGAIGGFGIWFWGLKVPPAILDNPAFSGIAAIAIGAVCGALVAFLLRLCWYPVYRWLHPYGGLALFLRAKLGVQMWPIILMASGFFSFVTLSGGGLIWLILQTSRGSADIHAPPITASAGQNRPEVKRFYSQKDKENLSDICSELVGLLRRNGADGGGEGAWKKIATLANDWAASREKPSPDIPLLVRDLAAARASVDLYLDGLYGVGGIFKKYDSYHQELEEFFQPDYTVKLHNLLAVVDEFGTSIPVLEQEMQPGSRQKLFVALKPSYEKYSGAIAQFQKNLFEITQRVDSFRKQLQS